MRRREGTPSCQDGETAPSSDPAAAKCSRATKPIVEVSAEYARVLGRRWGERTTYIGPWRGRGGKGLGAYLKPWHMALFCLGLGLDTRNDRHEHHRQALPDQHSRRNRCSRHFPDGLPRYARNQRTYAREQEAAEDVPFFQPLHLDPWLVPLFGSVNKHGVVRFRLHVYDIQINRPVCK